jgi:hypothetical protein
VPPPSPREGYPWSIRQVELTHSIGAESEEPLARRGRVRDERRHVYGLARRHEGSQPLDAFFEEHGRAMKVAATPVVKPDADLEDAVVESAHRRSRVAPQELEGLVLLEKLAGVELLDATEERQRRRI